MKLKNKKFNKLALCFLFAAPTILISDAMLSPQEVEAAKDKWVFGTIKNTPAVDSWNHWGNNGIAILNEGNDIAKLYMYGEHYHTSTNAKPSKYTLNFERWNGDTSSFEQYQVIGTKPYANNTKRFYERPELNKMANGVYTFRHDATIAGKSHTGRIEQTITFSRFVTIGDKKNSKVALIYTDTVDSKTGNKVNDTKIRIRNAQAQSKLNSVDFNATNGITMDAQGAMTVVDKGADIEENTDGKLVEFEKDTYHIRGDGDTNKTGSRIYLKKENGTELFSVATGTEYTINSAKFRYGKRDMKFTANQLKSLDNGKYIFDYQIDVQSGAQFTRSMATTRLASTSKNYSKSFVMVGDDGNKHKYTLQSNNNNELELIVTDATPPTANTSQTPTGWTNGNVTLKLTSIADKGGSGYKNTQLPDGTNSTATSVNYTVSKNGTYDFVIYDNEGNKTVKSFNVTNIDKTNPTGTLTQTPTAWTNGNVTLKLSGVKDTGGSGYDYTLLPDGTKTTATSHNYNVTKNGTYKFVIYDKAGNSTTLTQKVTNIDKTAPTANTSQTPTGWTNGNVTLKLTSIADTGGSGYKNIQLPNGTYATATSANYSVSKNGTYDFTIYDNAGNKTVKSFKVTNIDKTNPTGTLTQTPTGSTNGDVTLKLSGVKDTGGSGYDYTLLPDGTKITTASHNYKVTKNGTYKFVIYDKAGNSTTLTQTVSNIDKTAPTGTLTQTPTAWTNGNVTLKLSGIKDTGGSGYDHTELPDGTKVTTTSHNYNVTTNGTYKFVIYDKAGNSTTLSQKVTNIDKTPPTGTFTFSTTAETNQNVKITLNASDKDSGVKSIQLSDGTVVNSSTATYSASKNGTYQFIVTDVAGNTATLNAKVDNIDETPPNLTLTPSTKDWTRNSVIITATATDNFGIKKIILPNKKEVATATASFEVTVNGDYEFKAMDTSGNVATKTIKISNIDKENPKTNISETSRTENKINIKMEYSD